MSALVIILALLNPLCVLLGAWLYRCGSLRISPLPPLPRLSGDESDDEPNDDPIMPAQTKGRPVI